MKFVPPGDETHWVLGEFPVTSGYVQDSYDVQWIRFRDGGGRTWIGMPTDGSSSTAANADPAMMVCGKPDDTEMINPTRTTSGFLRSDDWASDATRPGPWPRSGSCRCATSIASRSRLGNRLRLGPYVGPMPTMVTDAFEQLLTSNAVRLAIGMAPELVALKDAG